MKCGSGKQTKEWRKFSSHKRAMLYIALAIVLAIVVFVLYMSSCHSRPVQDSEKETVPSLTSSSLEKILFVHELSTCQAVYNGVVKVMDEKKADTISYYVSYEAVVSAGLEFDECKITVDEDVKRVLVVLPEIKVTSVEVDAGSLDYIFYDSSAESDTILAEAYTLCRQDAADKAVSEVRILDLARENAKNVTRALLLPFIEDFGGPEYILDVE